LVTRAELKNCTSNSPASMLLSTILVLLDILSARRPHTGLFCKWVIFHSVSKWIHDVHIWKILTQGLPVELKLGCRENANKKQIKLNVIIFSSVVNSRKWLHAQYLNNNNKFGEILSHYNMRGQVFFRMFCNQIKQDNSFVQWKWPSMNFMENNGFNVTHKKFIFTSSKNILHEIYYIE